MPALAVVVKGYPRLSETFIAQEFLELQRRGFDFEIWSLRAPYDDREHPVHAQITATRRYLPEYLHKAPGRVLRAWLRARRLPGYRLARQCWLADLRRDFTRNRIRRWGQALVLACELPAETRFLYAHFLHTPASVTRYAALMRGLGWGVSAHAKDIWTSPDWEKREKLADAAFCVSCTGSGTTHLSSMAPEGKVHLVYHGLDISRFPPPPERGVAMAPLRMLSVGRLVAKKGYDDLITALTLLPEALDWCLTHIGGGELKGRLSDAARRKGIADRIDWRGKCDQTEVIAAMRGADLFVLPSKIAGDGDRDGLPNVLMEAASQRLPILSTAVSAIPEFITDGQHGRLVPPGDPAALAAAIEAYAAFPAMPLRMADAALDRLCGNFGLAANIDRLDMLLRVELDKAKRPVPMTAF